MRTMFGAAAAWIVVVFLVFAGRTLAAGEAKTVEERNSVLGVVRLFKTAESDYFHLNGRYATFPELIKSKQLAQTAVGSQESLRAYFSLNLTSESEPVPGFVFGLDVPADGTTYKLSVGKPGDCSLAFRTDEKASVFEEKVSDCTAEATPEAAREPKPEAWATPEIDRSVPSARADVPCPLPQVLAATSQRARELEENLQKFTARELIEHLEIGKNGKQRSGSKRVFDYVAEIHESQDGGAYINEYRSEKSLSMDAHPVLADSGTAAFALLFLPHNLDEFSMTCEGLTDLNSRPVWQLHFVQRTDRENDFRAYRVNSQLYPANIKGRAWVAADTFEVLRLESDLVEPIRQINLQKEHLIIEYGPVAFPKRDVRLLLPDNVTLFIEYHGHRYERRHRFSNFQLFWVDTVQETKAPRLDKDAQIGKY